MSPDTDPPVAADVLRAEIASRLKAVCEHWPPEMFDELVRSIVAITMKYDIKGGVEYDRRTTERLIEEMKELANQASQKRGE